MQIDLKQGQLRSDGYENRPTDDIEAWLRTHNLSYMYTGFSTTGYGVKNKTVYFIIPKADAGDVLSFKLSFPDIKVHP